MLRQSLKTKHIYGHTTADCIYTTYVSIIMKLMAGRDNGVFTTRTDNYAVFIIIIIVGITNTADTTATLIKSKLCLEFCKVKHQQPHCVNFFKVCVQLQIVS
jgi:hypothetical protein